MFLKDPLEEAQRPLKTFSYVDEAACGSISSQVNNSMERIESEVATFYRDRKFGLRLHVPVRLKYDDRCGKISAIRLIRFLESLIVDDL